MSTPWTTEQRQWLRAMGHQLWTVAEPGAADAPDGSAIQEAAALLKPAPADRLPPARQGAAAARTPAQAPRTSPDRLMQAIWRAANCSVGDTAVSALLPDASALRGNAAAKRALWPQLRSLRRAK